MSINKKVLYIVFIMLIVLTVATIINVSYNFRAFAKESAYDKAISIAESVRDGLTAHMVNGTMDSRNLFLNNMIKHQEVSNLYLIRAASVVNQFGGQTPKDISDIDKKVLREGHIEYSIIDDNAKSMLRIAIPYIATSYSTPNCLQCHTDAKEGDVLGVLSMDIDITKLFDYGEMIVLKTIAITIIFLIFAVLLARYFIRPYIKLFDDLENGISKAYNGDFNFKISTPLKNEAGVVAERLNELSELFRFKKTIESDENREQVYKRFGYILKNHFKINAFIVLEVNKAEKTKKLLFKCQTDMAYPQELLDTKTDDCRALRTRKDVYSTDFHDICTVCKGEGNDFYLCHPFDINETLSLLLHIRTVTEDEIERIKTLLPVINNYLDIAHPVLDAHFLMEKLNEQSLRDAQTKLYNRRYLDRFIDRFEQNDQPACFLMIDIDFFKQVNDTYGHDIGDNVISGLATLLHQKVIAPNLAFRYGGEEFMVMVFHCNNDDALHLAETIKKEFASLTFQANGSSFSKTLSIGIAQYPKDGKNIWQVIKYADTALYEAKKGGRNKVVHFTKEMFQESEY